MVCIALWSCSGLVQVFFVFFVRLTQADAQMHVRFFSQICVMPISLSGKSSHGKSVHYTEIFSFKKKRRLGKTISTFHRCTGVRLKMHTLKKKVCIHTTTHHEKRAIFGVQS